MWYIHTLKYYSAIKKAQTLIHAAYHITKSLCLLEEAKQKTTYKYILENTN